MSSTLYFPFNLSFLRKKKPLTWDLFCFSAHLFFHIYNWYSACTELVPSQVLTMHTLTQTLLTTINCFITFFQRLFRQPSQASDDTIDDLEAGPTSRTDSGQADALFVNWTKSMVGFCLASAITLPQLPVQIYSELPTSTHCLFLAIVLGFSFLGVSNFINFRLLRTIRVLRTLGLLFSSTAFYAAISIPFPFHLKLIGWVVYSISLLVILISRMF